MTSTRRAYLLATAGAATTAGCLDVSLSSSESDPDPGNLRIGDDTIRPETDGSLRGLVQDWPTYQFDSQNTGHNPAIGTSVGREPRVRWHREVATEEDVLRGAPSIRDGSVFVTTEPELLVLDGQTGETEWTASLPVRGENTPTVTPNSVFIGTDDGLATVDRESETVDWYRRTGSSLAYHSPGVNGAPTYSDGRVFVGTFDGAMHGFDADTGDRLWLVSAETLPDETEPPKAGNTPAFNGPAAVLGETVFAGNFNGFLYAFDVTSGDRLWRVRSNPDDASVNPGPSVADETVFAVSDDSLSAFHPTDGTLLWRFRDSPGSMRYSATVTEEDIFVASGPSSGSESITAVDRADQTARWRRGGWPQESFSADAELLYVPLYGDLVALDRASGEVVWRLHTESVISGPPALSEGALVVADELGNIYGIEAEQ